MIEAEILCGSMIVNDFVKINVNINAPQMEECLYLVMLWIILNIIGTCRLL